MAEPYVKKFEFKAKGELIQLTSVIMDQKDFDALCEEFAGVMNVGSGDRVDEQQIAQLKAAGHIPLVQRGTKTEFLFERYGVDTDKMSLIVRGKGIEVFELMTGKENQ